VSELRTLFEDAITVESIFEDIQACLACDPAPSIQDTMHQRDFDVIGIKDSKDGPVDGYVKAEALGSGKCGDYKQEFHISDLISDSTHLIDIYRILGDKERVFVLVGNTVEGIITRADLQKPPLRILLFGLITLLEMHLSYLVRNYYPHDAWRDKLSAPRVMKAEEMMEARKRRNEELDLIDCLQLCDKRTLVLASSAIMTELKLESKKSGNKTLKDIEELRDKLFHAQDIVTGTNWEEVIALVENVEELIRRSEDSLKRKEEK
jgi:hypothetical protein